MANDNALHEYRIRYQVDSEEALRQVRAVADCTTQTVTVELPDGDRLTIDVVTARAVYMLLYEAVYSALQPSGPLLRLEHLSTDGWTKR